MLYLIDYITYGLQIGCKKLLFKGIYRKPIPEHRGLGTGLHNAVWSEQFGGHFSATTYFRVPYVSPSWSHSPFLSTCAHASFPLGLSASDPGFVIP